MQSLYVLYALLQWTNSQKYRDRVEEKALCDMMMVNR